MIITRQRWTRPRTRVRIIPMRANDPYRILTARLIGAARFTTIYLQTEFEAQAHLQKTAAGHPKMEAARAAADGARHWANRARSGIEDEARAKLASDRLRMLAEHLAGGPVEPTPAEDPRTVNLAMWTGTPAVQDG